VDKENNAIIEISKAELALERANDIHEMLVLRDTAAAYELLANAQGFKDAAQKAKIFQLKAERKAGEWLDKNVKPGNPQLLQDVTIGKLPEGISQIESHRWQLEAALPEEKFNEWVDDSLAKGYEISASGLQKLAKNHKRKEEREKIAEEGKNIEIISERWNIWQADIEDWIAPRQYDFIITDPPYPKEYLPLYETLSRRADEWLNPGGLLLVMCGHSYLDEIYQMLNVYLDYYWTGSYLTPGQATSLWQVNVNTNWKPILIYSKGKYTGKTFGDVFKSETNDKDYHKWGQSISGMSSIIEKFCLPGQYILDPFCGAGTTGVAALNNGCLFDGIDTDIESVNIAKARLHDTEKAR